MHHHNRPSSSASLPSLSQSMPSSKPMPFGDFMALAERQLDMGTFAADAGASSDAGGGSALVSSTTTTANHHAAAAATSLDAEATEFVPLTTFYTHVT